MSEGGLRLGASSEMLALSSVGQTKNILVCLIDLRGPMRPEIAFQAARKVASKFPQLVSVINDKRKWGLHFPEWKFCSPEKLPVFFHDISDRQQQEDSTDKILATISDRLERDWDLTQEVSSEFHCIKVLEQHFLIGWVLHHAAGDAAFASDIGQETILTYHEITRGQGHDREREYLSISGSLKRPAKIRKTGLRDHVKDLKQTVHNLFVRPSIPVGSGCAHDTGQNHAKRILSESESTELQGHLRSRGLSLVDTLVAASTYAIDNWNSHRNVNPGLITTSVSVNMRGRFQDIDPGNSSSLIFFESLPSDRVDRHRFLRSIAIRRIHHFRNHIDLNLVKNIKKMVDAIRIFPYRVRRRIVGFITDQHEFSTAVTLLGVIWPKSHHGKLNSDSSFTEIGELSVNEILGLPYKMLSRTKTLLVVYIFRKRLNFILSTSSCILSKQENEAYLDLILEELMKF